MDDIAPKLIENVNKDFERNLSEDKAAAALNEKLAAGQARYEDAYNYAESVGNARAKAFESQISSDVLPEGKMHYNIASRLMNDSLTTDHEMIADYAAGVQKAYNKEAGINLKALKADVNKDRIDGFVERLSSEPVYDDVSWLLKEPVVTHARSVVDDTIKKNAEFQGKAGIQAKVTRNAASECCAWCLDIAGDYIYPAVPREVFQRHDNCRCMVDYNGRKLTAYNSGNAAHTFRDQGEQERIENRSKYANSKVEKINKGVLQYRKKFNDGATMDYRSVLRDEYNRIERKTGDDVISASLLKDSKNDVYISDKATIKPKMLHKIESDIEKAQKITGIKANNNVKYVIVSDIELNSTSGGRFDPDTNTIFIKQILDEKKQQHIILHEHFHCKDLQDFFASGGIYRGRADYIAIMSSNCKEKLAKKGINAYNVSEISEYASRSFRLGRFDETYTEYRTVKAILEM